MQVCAEYNAAKPDLNESYDELLKRLLSLLQVSHFGSKNRHDDGFALSPRMCLLLCRRNFPTLPLPANASASCCSTRIASMP